MIYLRGRFKDNQPLLPDEIHFNQSLCLTCQRKSFGFFFSNFHFFFLMVELELTSMSTNPTIQDSTTDHILLRNSTNRPVAHIRLLNEDIPTSTSFQSPSFNSRKGLNKSI